MQKLSQFFARADLAIHNHFQGNNAALGRAYAVCSSMCVVLLSFVTKLSGEHNLRTVVFIRSMVFISVSFLLLNGQYGNTTIPNRKIAFMLVLRAILSTILISIFFGALIILPIQIVNIVFQTNIFVTYLLEMLFLGEKYTHVRLICLVAVVVGLALIINPDLMFLSFSHTNHEDLTPERLIAILSVLVGAIMKGMVNLLVRSFSSIDPMINTLFFGGVSNIFAGYSFTIAPKLFAVSWFGLACLIGSGFSSLCYQTFNMKAMRHSDASVVSMFEGLSFFFTFALDTFFFGIKPQLGSFVGSLLLLAALVVLSLSLKKQQTHPPTESSTN